VSRCRGWPTGTSKSHSRGRRYRLCDEGRRGAIRKGGCDAYLSKPISVAKFIETVSRLIGIGGGMLAVHRGKQLNASTGRRRRKA